MSELLNQVISDLQKTADVFAEQPGFSGTAQQVSETVKELKTVKSELEAAISRAEKAEHEAKMATEIAESGERELASVKAQIAELKEQLRWRKWPDEKPEHWQIVLIFFNSEKRVARYTDDTVAGKELHDREGKPIPLCEGQNWMPYPAIPELVESPPTETETPTQKANINGIAYLGGYLIDNHEDLFPGGEQQIQTICVRAAEQMHPQAPVESPPTRSE